MVINMAEFLTTYISLGIALASILFVVWDHFKDDRLLTKRVQSFYWDLEGLVYTYYKTKLIRDQFDESNDKKSCEEKFFQFQKKNVFFRGKVSLLFEDFSKYLGLTYFRKSALYCIQNYDYLIESTGAFQKFRCKLPQIEIGNELCFYDNQHKRYAIDEDNLDIINRFFELLRDYWKTYYHKKFFRRGIKAKFDFSDLLQ
jgi:hypothetical protein